jgi:hypothetical protein
MRRREPAQCSEAGPVEIGGKTRVTLSDKRFRYKLQSTGKEVAAAVENQVRIVGPLTAVFDLVTTARFWPRWHPASRAVAGVIERPYQLGDVIFERISFRNKLVNFTWRVAEHVRPQRVVLQAENADARIDYSFAAEGPVVLFTRIQHYNPEPSHSDASRERQYVPSRLKALVESILVQLPQGRDASQERQNFPDRLKELVESILAAEARGFS